MNELERTEWQIRCVFNDFYKRTLKNERIDAHRDIRKRQAHEINFSHLTKRKTGFIPVKIFLQKVKNKPFSQVEKN